MRAWARSHRRVVGVGVIVAALTLVGVAVVLGFAIFERPPQIGQPDATASAPAEPSNQPTAEPSASSEPTATPTPTAAAPATPGLAWPPVGEPGYHVSWRLWVVSTVDDLNIRSGPGPEHPAVGQLDAGDLAFVMDGALGPEWIQIAADGVIGYANIGPEEDRYLLSTPTPWKAYFTQLEGVASNGSTYLAYGMASEHDYVPYGGGNGTLFLASDDGLTWTRPPESPPGTVHAIAAGPGGWVALSVAYPGASLVSFSADGRTWEDPQGQGGSSVAFGPGGWVVVGGGDAWRSADGRTWGEPVAIGLDPAAGDPELEASDAGYVVFQRHCCTQPWASADGENWNAVDLPIGIDDWVSDVELIGDRMLVLVGDAASGETLLHRGRLSTAGAVTWDAQPSLIREGFRVASISQGPDGLLASGWDSDELIPALWRSADGASWERLNASADALGGAVGLEPAWGSAGWVGLGTSVDGAGQQLWRSPDGEAWQPTGEPIAYTGPLPPCPPAGEVSTLILMYLSPFAEHCFGGAALTIRAWVPAISFLGDGAPGAPEPSWLARSWGSFLSPGPLDDRLHATLSIHTPPALDTSALQIGRWVEVIGHFRDEAAATCMVTPPSAHSMGGRTPDDAPAFVPHLLVAPNSVRHQCEGRFVVESITVVEGP